MYETEPGRCAIAGCPESHPVTRVPSLWRGAPDQYRGEHHGAPYLYERWMVRVTLVKVTPGPSQSLDTQARMADRWDGVRVELRPIGGRRGRRMPPLWTVGV